MSGYKRGAYKKVSRICENCGASFLGTSKSRFCSNRCRVADFRKKYKKSK